ncbi:hypothetical protein MCOR25_008067 [Pyricularia grisea]|nr:hypothetical protein MCOR25_008067 [Pyricularia grisea]
MPDKRKSKRQKFTRPGAEGRTKSRTGCLTCKQRRKKCDEVKPKCGGCLVERWDCEFSVRVTIVKAPWQNQVASGSATIVRARPALLPDLTQQELEMFSFYAKQRMGSVDLIFNDTEALDFIIKISMSEPCVRQAVLAASYAVRHSFFPAADHSGRARDLEGLLRHYNLAIGDLVALQIEHEGENQQAVVRRRRPDCISAIICASFVLASVDHISTDLSSTVLGEEESAGRFRTMFHLKALCAMLQDSKPISLIDDGGRGAWDRNSQFDDEIAMMAGLVSTFLTQTSLYDEEVQRFTAQKASARLMT